MRTVRTLASIHLLAWSQTLSVLAGAMLPGARPKNRAAKVIRLVERVLKPGEKLAEPSADMENTEEARVRRERQNG